MLVAALLTVYAVAAATSVRQKSITFDELGHLTGGVSSWVTGDYRLFPQNGQFPQRWAALPLIVSAVRFPSLNQPAWWTSDVDAIGYQFLYAAGNDHDAMLWRARVAMIPLAILLGWVCYSWARRLFGPVAGSVALFVFVFSPSMLAHGPLATSDVAAALMFVSALGCFWSALHRPSALRVLGSALVTGVLFVTKMSALLMVPVVLALTLIRIARGTPLIWSGTDRRIATDRRRLLAGCAAIVIVHIVGIAFVIWAFYGFRYATFSGGLPGRDQMWLGETIDTLAEGNLTERVITLARGVHLLPEAYLFGVAHVLNRSGRFVGFLNGQYSINGWWYFFPYCWMLKTPISVFALLVLAAGAGWRSLYRSNNKLRRLARAGYRLAPLFVFLIVYWTAALVSRLNLGERHLLPTYPVLFILIGGAGCWLGRTTRLAAAAVGLSLLLLSVESIGMWPHYLAYFNRLAGGPASGYRHLVDSSLDWGQDLPGLKQWMDRTASNARLPRPVYLSYFGSGDPAHYGIDGQQIYSYQDWRRERPLHELKGGTYCISATMLQSVYTIARGRWSVPYEREYQRERVEIDRASPAAPDPSGAGVLRDADLAWRRLVSEFDQLRLARLCAYLRRREPDDHVGYSILIYQLSDDEVERALKGPPAELLPDPQIEGMAPRQFNGRPTR